MSSDTSSSALRLALVLRSFGRERSEGLEAHLATEPRQGLESAASFLDGLDPATRAAYRQEAFREGPSALARLQRLPLSPATLQRLLPPHLSGCFALPETPAADDPEPTAWAKRLVEEALF